MKIQNSQSKNVELGQLQKAKNAKAAERGNPNEVKRSDEAVGDAASVEISSKAKAAAEARKIALSEDSNDEKVQRLKALINSGQYNPNYGEVADRVVNESILQDLS